MKEDLELIQNLKNILNGQINIFATFCSSYSEISTKFIIELGRLLHDLENKSDDIPYIKNVLETYKSILDDNRNLTKQMTEALEQSEKIKSLINGDKRNDLIK